MFISSKFVPSDHLPNILSLLKVHTTSKFSISFSEIRQFLCSLYEVCVLFQSYISFGLSAFKLEDPLLPSVIGLPPMDDGIVRSGDAGRSESIAKRRVERGGPSAPSTQSSKSGKNRKKRKPKNGSSPALSSGGALLLKLQSRVRSFRRKLGVPNC